jgi:hypothetical protein
MVGTQRNNMIKILSAGIKSYVEDGGWTIVGDQNKSRWRTITEEEYGEDFAATKLFETFTEMANIFQIT